MQNQVLVTRRVAEGCGGVMRIGVGQEPPALENDATSREQVRNTTRHVFVGLEMC
jgi:hypothetical protein